MTEGASGGIVGACVILALSFLVGAPGNLLVIWTILRHMKRRSHTVTLILHLAAADLLVLITVPLWIYAFARSWVFGEAACKAMTYIIYSCTHSSVFLITVMSVERFVSVRYPVASLRWKNKKNVLSKVLLVLWSAALLFSIPAILTKVVDEEDGEVQCLYRRYSSTGQEIACLLLEILVGFVVPFSVLAVCYGCLLCQIKRLTFRTKQKSTALIAAVVAVFLLCWLPHQVGNVLSLVIIDIQESNPSMADSLETARDATVYMAGALIFIGSSVNPLLYVFAARHFRGSLQATGILSFFRHISISGADDGAKELSVMSKRRGSENDCTKYTTDTKVSTDADLNPCEDNSS
ncbi:C3a anaphylatoxin chemotactic receptor-like [Conger conger]|uniref:C3a anaphylatoxin chemotactic receptor-like n=1 Tax=Conger conger TaxID=82655 RepID=UPI002A5A18F3|nr:C3a anaphylatoxin chemotactic receptor-like [Conger conger]